MKMPMQKALASLEAINALNSHDQVVEKRVVSTPYAFRSGVQQIAKLRGLLRQTLATHEEARNALILELSKGTGEISQGNDPDAFKLYNAELRKMLDEPVELAAEPLPIALLRLDDNPVPPWVVDTLTDAGLLTA